MKLSDLLARTLVLDYFALGRIKFINKYFEDDKDLLEKATTAESYRTIVENLRNPVQISAVGIPLTYRGITAASDQPRCR